MSKVEIENLSLWFGSKQVLKNVSFGIEEKQIIALIGPSGCGKSTLLRSINRMHDRNPEVKITGAIKLDGQDIYQPSQDVNHLRTEVGMVFQKPNPFPKSIQDNIAFGLKIQGWKNRKDIQERVKKSLEQAYLWEEVAQKLSTSALSLSGGQQQRLCIASTIAVAPQVVLMDEPTSALDPIATQNIEQLIMELKKQYTIVIVTHNMQQARRIADKIAMLYLGELVEYSDTEDFFNAPKHELSRRYVSGKFG